MTLLESEVVLLAEEVVPKNVASAMMLEFKNTLDLGVWDEEIYLDEKLPPGCVPLMLITTESLDGLGELVKVRCRLVARGGQAKCGGLPHLPLSVSWACSWYSTWRCPCSWSMTFLMFSAAFLEAEMDSEQWVLLKRELAERGGRSPWLGI